MRKFEETKLTTLITGALLDAVIHIERLVDTGAMPKDHCSALAVKEYKNLYNKIKQDHLDVSFTSREY